MSTWPVVQYEVTVPAQIAQRFCAWAVYMADKVEPNKAIRLTLLKPNGEPYSDATFHTQMNAVLHDESMLKAHPVLKDYRLKYVHKSTTLFMVKDHRQTSVKDSK